MGYPAKWYSPGSATGRVWFGTYAGGPRFTIRRKRIGRPTRPKASPPQKRTDGKSINWKNLLPYNHVSVVVPDTDKVWFGTYFMGSEGRRLLLSSAKEPSLEGLNTNGDRAKKVVSLAWTAIRLGGFRERDSLLDKKTGRLEGPLSLKRHFGNFVTRFWSSPIFVWAGLTRH